MRKITRTALVGAIVSPLLFASVPAASAAEVPGRQGTCKSFNRDVTVNNFEVRTAKTVDITITSRVKNPVFTVTTTAYTPKGQKLWLVDISEVSGTTRTLRLDNPVRKGWFVSSKVTVGGAVGGALSSCVAKDQF